MKLKNVIVEITSALFILLFVYTAINKILEFSSFQETLKESPLMSVMYIPVSWGVPIVELLITVLLFLPRFRKYGLYASFFLMALFTVYIGYMLIYTPKLPCSCGGIISSLSWKQHLVLNSTLTLLALVAIVLQKKINKNPNAVNRKDIAFQA